MRFICSSCMKKLYRLQNPCGSARGVRASCNALLSKHLHKRAALGASLEPTHMPAKLRSRSSRRRRSKSSRRRSRTGKRMLQPISENYRGNEIDKRYIIKGTRRLTLNDLQNPSEFKNFHGSTDGSCVYNLGGELIGCVSGHPKKGVFESPGLYVTTDQIWAVIITS